MGWRETYESELDGAAVTCCGRLSIFVPPITCQACERNVRLWFRSFVQRHGSGKTLSVGVIGLACDECFRRVCNGFWRWDAADVCVLNTLINSSCQSIYSSNADSPEVLSTVKELPIRPFTSTLTLTILHRPIPCPTLRSFRSFCTLVTVQSIAKTIPIVEENNHVVFLFVVPR